jgi:hypothetical protein
LFDPALNTLEHGMTEGDAAALDLETVSGLIAQSEIDFGALRNNIRALLDEQSQASIGDVLNRFPAAQGLGSVVGYIALGSKYGTRVEQRRETVSWCGQDEQRRSARIPAIYFLKEKYDELT